MGIVIEGDPLREDQHVPPVLPEEYIRRPLTSIPRIPLPNGRFVFYVHELSGMYDELKQDPRISKQILASSWLELFYSNYRYWDFVFDADVTVVRDGQEYRTRMKLASVTTEEIHGLHVPGVFQTDEIPELTTPNFLIERFRRMRADTQLIVPCVRAIDDRLIEYLRRNPREMHNLRPRQFEELIYDILSSFGWSVELTPESKDGGYDIVGVSGSVGGLSSSWIVECKKYRDENRVGVGVVRSLCGVKEQVKAANAMIVTSSTFTRGAIELARSRWDLSLRDYNDILEWLDRTKS